MLEDGKTYFYGGYIHVDGDISIEAVDKILDLLDEYIELVEAITEKR